MGARCRQAKQRASAMDMTEHTWRRRFAATTLTLMWLLPAPGCMSDDIHGGSQDMTVPEHGVHYLEIITADIEAARDLYSEAYGWQFGPTVPELGNAYVATIPGGSICGIRAPMHDQELQGVRTYLRVADIAAATARAAELGAMIALGPTELPGHGTISIYIHSGIEQGLWQVP